MSKEENSSLLINLSLKGSDSAVGWKSWACQIPRGGLMPDTRDGYEEKYPSNAQGQGTATDGIDWHITSDLPVKL